MRLDDADALYLDGPVDRAYLGTELVWEAIITVTPEAPVFHDGEPWVTLPDMEGVTYTVDGTTGYGQTVTVTATAQDGYQLDGQTEWEHTYGPPPRYEASDSGGARPRLTQNTWTTIATHGVVGGGTSSGTWQVTWRYAFNGNVDIRVLRNSTILAASSVNNPQSSPYTQAVTIPTVVLSDGDALTFQALYNAGGANSGRYVDAWSWNLS